jgi:hypothetical protein
MTSYLTQLIAANVAPLVQARLQPELNKFIIGGLIRSRLPQTWWLVSSSGSGTLYVDQNGNASAHDGQAGTPDGVITWTDQAFYTAIVLQDRSKIPPQDGQPNVDIRTRKG